MILEKDKVYKIRHDFREYYCPSKWRNYIICSPIKDIDTENLKLFSYLSLRKERYTNFDCHFVVCFDGKTTKTNRKDKDSQTAFYESCEIMSLEEEDLNDVRKAVTMLGVKYNRKLNKLVL